MRRILPDSGWLVALGLTAIMWPVGTVLAQTVVAGSNGTVSVHSVDVPLRRVLESLAALRPFERLNIDPAIEARPVTVSLDGVSVRAALIAVLEASQADYALTVDAEGNTARVVVRGQRAAEELPPVAAAPPRHADAKELELEAGYGGTREGKPVAVGEPQPNPATTAQIEEAEREQIEARQRIEYALTVPRVQALPGDVILLPVPGPDGAPRTAVVPAGAQPPVLPFTGAAGPSGPAWVPLPLSADPSLRSLYEALVAPGGPLQ